ncbi:unnamed protein product, partial [Didymodactylos carnosus]
QKNVAVICERFHSAKDRQIQFASQTLSAIITHGMNIDEINDPDKFSIAYFRYVANMVDKSRQTQQENASKNFKGISRMYRSDQKVGGKFLTKPFLEKLKGDIEDLTVNDHESHRNICKNTNRSVRICSKMDTNKVKSLLDPIIRCLRSERYLSIFETIVLHQPKRTAGAVRERHELDPKQSLFIRECPEFIIQHSLNRQDEIAQSLCKTIFGYTETIFNKHLSTIIGGEETNERDEMMEKSMGIEALGCHIKLLNYFASTPSTRKEFISSQIIDQILMILTSDNEQLYHPDAGVISYSITLLYNLMFEKQLVAVLKEKNISNICSKLQLRKDKRIQFASQTLLVTLDEKIDIDTIHDPDKLLQAFIYYIKNSIDELRQSHDGVKLDGVLEKFKIIIKNEIIKEKIVEDKEGLLLITKCVYGKFDESTIQLPALDIIREIMFFGPKAIEKLKNNDLLIDKLVSLSNEETDNASILIKTIKKMKKKAAALMWNIGNEQASILKRKEKEKQQSRTTTDETIGELFLPEYQLSDTFDLIISYCYIDKQICHKIYNRLMATNSYRIWINKDNNSSGLQLQAINNSKMVLVCMSSKYRESQTCMTEIEYANKQKRPIIPLLVESKYKPKGWLNVMIGSQGNIDFTVAKDFDSSIFELIRKIDVIKNPDET